MPNRLPLSLEQIEKTSQFSPTIEALQEEIKSKNISPTSSQPLEENTSKQASIQNKPTPKESKSKIQYQELAPKKTKEIKSKTKKTSSNLDFSQKAQPKTSSSLPIFNLINPHHKK